MTHGAGAKASREAHVSQRLPPKRGAWSQCHGRGAVDRPEHVAGELRCATMGTSPRTALTAARPSVELELPCWPLADKSLALDDRKRL
jgi:hypothetical protein